MRDDSSAFTGKRQGWSKDTPPGELRETTGKDVDIGMSRGADDCQLLSCADGSFFHMHAVGRGGVFLHNGIDLRCWWYFPFLAMLVLWITSWKVDLSSVHRTTSEELARTLAALPCEYMSCPGDVTSGHRRAQAVGGDPRWKNCGFGNKDRGKARKKCSPPLALQTSLPESRP